MLLTLSVQHLSVYVAIGKWVLASQMEHHCGTKVESQTYAFKMMILVGFRLCCINVRAPSGGSLGAVLLLSVAPRGIPCELVRNANSQASNEP